MSNANIIDITLHENRGNGKAHFFQIFNHCEAQGKGRAKGRPRKVT